MKNAMFEEGVKCLGYMTWGPIDILASMCNMDKTIWFCLCKPNKQGYYEI